MRQRIFACLLVMCFYQGSTLSAAALSQSVVIRTAQPYSFSLVNGVLTKTASQELVEIENISADTVDMTGWSLKYQTVSGTTLQTLRSVIPNPGAQFTLFPAHARDTFISTSYATNHSITSGLTFGLSLADSGGSVVLVNALGQEVDRVGWRTGSVVNIRSETEAVLLTSDTSTMQRNGPDTDNNAKDFRVLAMADDPGFMFGGMYDASDVCSNLDGIQEVSPPGMTPYDDGTCIATDRCSNIDGIQIAVPEFYDRQGSGECIEHDACLEIEGIQHIVPDGYELENGACVLKFAAKKIVLSELLANPEGVDVGHEYIEIYNDSDETANLADYSVQFSGKTYHFPNGKLLLPHTFMSFSDDDLDVTFPNTTGVEIKLVSKDGTITSIMPSYSNAPASQSWSKIGDEWEYTNIPTRDAENRPSVTVDLDTEEVASATYSQCAANQYRSPETNRCRLIATNAITLAPCKDGQYRSEETNRCRSILQAVSASLKPCEDDQFRNPLTGRCKKIASTDDILQPCDDGWERNVDTNRCRKIKATSMPIAAFPVQAIAPTANSVSTWLVAAAVIVGALCYAIWEWRYEASALAGRIFKR